MILLAPSAIGMHTDTAPGGSRESYIVVLTDGNARSAVATKIGVSPARQFYSVFAGFTADLTPQEAERVRADPRVRGIAINRQVKVSDARSSLAGYPPSLPNGVNRIDAEFAPIDETAGVAILDSGIDLGRPEFNVRGVFSEISSAPSGQDDFGHGTHVAGIAAANTMPDGFRGVAPRAPLWVFKVLDSTGSGDESGVIAAIDWLTVNGPAAGIRVANMSFAAAGNDTGNCGTAGKTVIDPLHFAICQAAEAGIIFTAAAGNAGVSSDAVVPAAYPEVVTVSSFTDLDGGGGALGGSTDDAFSSYSNFGAPVDIAAPGTSILSTVPTGTCALCAPTGYTYLSGTSMAAPHAAGAVAEYFALHPDASSIGGPGALASGALAVISQGRSQSGPCGFTGDTDGIAEPVLYVGIPDTNCSTVSPADSDGDGLPDIVEVDTYHTDPSLADTDGDGCTDMQEVLGTEALGGRRDATSPWDFYDLPSPADPLSPASSKDRVVSALRDVPALVRYIGARAGGGRAGQGVSYDADLDGNGIPDGQEFDRSTSLYSGQPWRTGPPDGAVSALIDIPALVSQIGHRCN